jgi:hypothetical protein
MRSSTAICLVIFILVSAAICARQQNPPFGAPPPKDEQRQQIEKDMAKKANEQRQAEIRRDSEQLLKLATELKQYVDRSNENILSVEVVHKAEEIERLAHSVKEKMKGP